MMNRKLRMGMVGGGSDAFIGAIHRLAALWTDKSNWSAAASVSILKFHFPQGNRIIFLKIGYIKPIRKCSKAKLSSPKATAWIL